jgi:hypothetical protein
VLGADDHVVPKSDEVHTAPPYSTAPSFAPLDDDVTAYHSREAVPVADSQLEPKSLEVHSESPIALATKRDPPDDDAIDDQLRTPAELDAFAQLEPVSEEVQIVPPSATAATYDPSDDSVTDVHKYDPGLLSGVQIKSMPVLGAGVGADVGDRVENQMSPPYTAPTNREPSTLVATLDQSRSPASRWICQLDP